MQVSQSKEMKIFKISYLVILKVFANITEVSSGTLDKCIMSIYDTYGYTFPQNRLQGFEEM